MSTPETTHDRAVPEADGIPERNIDLAFDLAQAIVADPALLAEIPRGATVVLIPDDDPELAAANIAGGHRAVAAGENVYFRHVRRAAAAATAPVGE